MSRTFIAGVVAACAVLTTSVPSVTEAQLQSVDEAVKISRKTGRPIFALAGSKT